MQGIADNISERQQSCLNPKYPACLSRLSLYASRSRKAASVSMNHSSAAALAHSLRSLAQLLDVLYFGSSPLEQVEMRGK